MILVTGGAGYIGSHLNKMLHQLGQETVVLDNLSRGHRELVKWGVFEEVDLLDMEGLRKVFQRYPISAVVHFAALSYVHESMRAPLEYYNNNLSGAVNLLQAMVEHEVRDIIFSSTCAVYGMATQTPLTEEHQYAPVNPYGRSKRMVEQMLEDSRMAHGVRFAALRYFNAAGADPDAAIGEWHEPETHLIPLTLEAAMGLRPRLTIFGDQHNSPDGTCVRDYIHVNDLADAHIKVLDYLQKEDTSVALNLGNGDGYSVRQVVQTVERVTGTSVPHDIGPANPGDPPQLVAGAGKARELLDWNPRFPKLEQIVETAYVWRQKLQRDFGV